jgi:hypothetical protein
MLAQMAGAGLPIPPDVLIEASSLRNKKALLERMKGAGQDPAQAQAQQQAQALMQAEQEAKVRLLGAQADKATADAQARMLEAQQPPDVTAAPTVPDVPTPLDEAEQMANIQYTEARTFKTLKDANRPPPQPGGTAGNPRRPEVRA